MNDLSPLFRSFISHLETGLIFSNQVWLGIFLGFGGCVECVIPGGSRGAGFRLLSLLRAAIRRRSPAALAVSISQTGSAPTARGSVQGS